MKPSPFNSNITHLLATSSADATVKIWDFTSSSNWNLIRTYSNHSDWIGDIEWLDADTLASNAIADREIKIWSISSGQTKRTIDVRGFRYSVECLKYLNNKIHLAAGFNNGDINIFNINDGSLFTTLKGQTWASVEGLVLLNSDLLASSSGDFDYSILIWNLTTYKTKFILKGHTWTAYSLKQVSSDILASGSLDSTIKLWNFTSGELIRTLAAHMDGINWSVDLMNNGSQKVLVSAGWIDQMVKFWNWSSGELLRTIQINPMSNIVSMVILNAPYMNQGQRTTTSIVYLLFR
jgi:WD40 repeat protein